VLHISGLSLETLEQDGGLIPGAEFLAKPFSPNALVKKVDQMLSTPHDRSASGLNG
jgi:hypothetical protein